jgi:hypothetical protein
LWLRWTLLCAAGEIIGIGVAAGAIALLLATLGEPTTAAKKAVTIVVAVAAGALEGFAVGYFQWAGLRLQLPSIPRRDWVKASVIAAATGWLLGMAPSTFFFGQENTGDSSSGPPNLVSILLAIPLGVGAGALFGTAQWVVLRRHAANAATWITANALGWPIAMVWIFMAASLPPDGTSAALLTLAGVSAGLFSGLTVGAVTGYFLLRLVPNTADHRGFC